MSMQANMGESPEQSFQYDDVCRIVGHLYLDSFHKVQAVELQAQNMLEQLRIQNTTLIKEAEELEAELEKHDGI